MLYTSDMNRVQTAWAANNVRRVLELLNVHRPEPGQSDLRGFEWHYWNRQCHSDLRTVKLPVVGSRCCMSDDGTRIAAMTNDERSNSVIKVWSTETGVEMASFPVRPHIGLAKLLFHPDGKHLAITTRAWQGAGDGKEKIQMFDIVSGSLSFTIQSPAFDTPSIVDVWFSDDGSRMARVAKVIDKNGREPPQQSVVKFWNAQTGNELDAIPIGSEPIFNYSISPDGTRVVVQYVTDNNDVYALNPVHIMKIAGSKDQLVSPTQTITIPLTRRANYLLFSPDGKHLFFSGFLQALGNEKKDRGSALFDVDSGLRLLSLADVTLSQVSFSPDGNIESGRVSIGC